MFSSLYYYFFIKIWKNCLLFEVICIITFSMHQIPMFLMKMKGFNFGLHNLAIMLGLGLLEFFNFLTIISCILAVFVALFDNFIFNDMKVFCVQIAFSSVRLFKVILAMCSFYGILFVINDVVILPQSNLFLQKKTLEIYKNHILYSVAPRHVVNIPEFNMNISIVDRVKNHLYGCLLNCVDQNLFLVIRQMQFEQENMLKLNLLGAKGKLNVVGNDIEFACDSGAIDINLDVIKIAKKRKKFKTWYEILKNFKFFFLSLLIAFWAFSFVFSKNFWVICGSSLSFVILLGDVMDFLNCNVVDFIFLSFVLVFYFLRVVKCLDF